MSSIVAYYGKPLEPYMSTQGYFAHIESLKMILRDGAQTRKLPIPPDVSYSYQGNLTALLIHLGIERRYHDIIMAVNGLTSIHDVTTEMTYLYIPSNESMSQTQSLYKQYAASF